MKQRYTWWQILLGILGLIVIINVLFSLLKVVSWVVSMALIVLFIGCLIWYFSDAKRR